VTDHNLPQEEKAYAAGYLEGYLSWFQIYQFVINSNGGQPGYSHALKKFLEHNEAYVRTQMAQKINDPFWHHVGLMYHQFDGLYDGYKKATGGNPNYLFEKHVVYSVNLAGDLDDLCPAFGCDDRVLTCEDKASCQAVFEEARERKSKEEKEAGGRRREYPVPRTGDSHCSILVKPLGGVDAPSDIVFGHTVC
jgi:hypothetical protein